MAYKMGEHPYEADSYGNDAWTEFTIDLRPENLIPRMKDRLARDTAQGSPHPPPTANSDSILSPSVNLTLTSRVPHAPSHQTSLQGSGNFGTKDAGHSSETQQEQLTSSTYSGESTLLAPSFLGGHQNNLLAPSNSTQMMSSPVLARNQRDKFTQGLTSTTATPRNQLALQRQSIPQMSLFRSSQQPQLSYGDSYSQLQLPFDPAQSNLSYSKFRQVQSWVEKTAVHLNISPATRQQAEGTTICPSRHDKNMRPPRSNLPEAYKTIFCCLGAQKMVRCSNCAKDLFGRLILDLCCPHHIYDIFGDMNQPPTTYRQLLSDDRNSVFEIENTSGTLSSVLQKTKHVVMVPDTDGNFRYAVVSSHNSHYVSQNFQRTKIRMISLCRAHGKNHDAVIFVVFLMERRSEEGVRGAFIGSNDF